MALIPPHYLNAVASIEVDSVGEDGKTYRNSIATGFLLGTPQGKKNEQGNELYNVSFVTNRHVYEDKRSGKKLEKVFLKFNKMNGVGHYFEVDLLKEDGVPIWFKHKNDLVDIAIFPIDTSVFKSAEIAWHFFNSTDLFFAKDFSVNNIAIGDGLFVLGFPMGINGKAKNSVIARHGIIARVDDEVLDNHYYYIDASAYPGNSGGPVIHKPEVVAITGTSSNSSAGLIGVISSGETYSEIAISKQTGEPRIIFTEQTGLVRVVPIESVVETIDDFITAKKTETANLKKAEEPNNTKDVTL